MSSHKTSVLIVDDSPEILDYLCTQIKNAGYDVSEAASGPEALEILKTKSFHVVISDFRMPGMTGLQLIKNARPLYPKTQFCICSSDVFSSHQEFIDAGVSFIWEKGMAMDKLLLDLESLGKE